MKPQRRRMADVQAVTRARGVEIVGLVTLDEAVVSGVVNAFHRQGGAEVVALCGVVVNDVKDYLEACVVQRPDHRFELVYLTAREPDGAVGAVGGEEADAVVTPVVTQAPFQQVRVLDELVHGHQLDCGDPEVDQVADHGGMGQPRGRSPQLLAGTSGCR